MPSEAFEKMMDRAMSDEEFASKLRSDPGGAMAEYDLTDEERQAVLSGDGAQLESVGVDQRVSKALSKFY